MANSRQDAKSAKAAKQKGKSIQGVVAKEIDAHMLIIPVLPWRSWRTWRLWRETLSESSAPPW